MTEFVTELGCKVRLDDAPEHLGEGAMLRLRMDDGRSAEVFLDPVSVRALYEGLQDYGVYL